MNESTLRNLLAEADRGATSRPCPDADILLSAALSQRRRTRRRLAGAAAAIAVVAASALMLRVPSGADPAQNDDAIASVTINSDAARSLQRPVRSADAARHRRDLAHLEREARLHLQVVHAVLDQSSASSGAESLPRRDDAEFARLEAARSAALSWQYATQVEQEFHDADEARRQYQRLVERFPGTSWAKLAATSLRRLSEGEDSPRS